MYLRTAQGMLFDLKPTLHDLGGTALCSSTASGARQCQAPAAVCTVHVTLQLSVKHLQWAKQPGCYVN